MEPEVKEDDRVSFKFPSLSTPEDWAVLWEGLVGEVLKYSTNGNERVEGLKPQTKMWILQHILPAPTTRSKKEVVKWVFVAKGVDCCCVRGKTYSAELIAFRCLCTLSNHVKNPTSFRIFL